MTAVGARIFSVILLATCVAAADDAEFAFNLLSDIAPILALFGDQFARQFTSESLTWVDHLIFAMVPLGIITAITSAIRVQGMQVAKAFIGRARENRALAEIELMSSTSGEVCELFNGSSIVRAMGKPKIAQLIIFPEEYDKLEEEHRESDKIIESTTTASDGAETSTSDPQAGEEDKSCGIHTLRTATSSNVETSGLMQCDVYQSESYAFFENIWRDVRNSMASSRAKIKAILRISSEKLNDEEKQRSEGSPGSARPSPEDYKRRFLSGPEKALDGPPNLQLNLSSDHFDTGTLKKRHEIILAALISVLLQTALITVAAITVFYVGPNSSNIFESRAYGFPCYVIGSVLLSLGTGLCSFIVEHSTVEYSWRPSSGKPVTEMNAPRLVWLQQKQTVNDQAFEGYVISAGPKRRIITSSRNDTIQSHAFANSHRSEEPRQAKHTKKDVTNDDRATDNGVKKGAVGKMPTGKSPTKSNIFWEWLTVGATLSAAIGFTAQFMGLRGLAFPCSIAQLGAIFVMALIRAGIRRRLGRIPDYLPAFSGYELDFLATEIAFYPKFRGFQNSYKIENARSAVKQPKEFFQWTVATPDRQSKDPFFLPKNELSASPSKEHQADTSFKTGPSFDQKPADESVTSQQLLRVRERLGNLTKWTSRSSSSAVSLAQSIELIMDNFFASDAPGTLTSLNWLLEAERVTSSERPSGQDTFQIRIWREKPRGKWRVDLGKIDAALSLWMARIDARSSTARNDVEELRAGNNLSRKTKMVSDTTKVPSESQSDWRRAKSGDSLTYSFYRILGDNVEDGVLKRDISWWIDSLVADQSHGYKTRDDADLVIGFNGIQHEAHLKKDRELGIISSASLPVILSQHMFTSFMWTVVQHWPKGGLSMRSDEGHDDVEVDPPQLFNSYEFDQTWLRLRLRHRVLTTLVRQMESYGLGSKDDILLCMIPALSSERLLPNQAIRRLIPHFGPHHGWSETAACHVKLLGKIKSCVRNNEDEAAAAMVKKRKENEDKLNVAIITAAMDFLSLAYDPYDEQHPTPPEDLNDNLHAIVGELVSSKLAPIMQKLVPVYSHQHRQKLFQTIFEQCSERNEISNFLPAFRDTLDKDFAASTLDFTDHHLKVLSSVDDDEFDDLDIYQFYKQGKPILRI